jgi:7-carboxy-7-deazaguanine synthase
MEYPINETFYSLKGEGMHTGTPMFFIRFSGCNLVCDFCDTLHEKYTPMTLEDLIKQVLLCPADRVVITGGEPTMYDLQDLCSKITECGRAVHLETNGTNPISRNFDWVACSPKSEVGTLDYDVLHDADEIKFLVGTPNWQRYIDTVMETFHPQGMLYVMPLSVGGHEGIRGPEDIVQDNVKLAMQYCLDHPDFSLCLQVHKILSIR